MQIKVRIFRFNPAHDCAGHLVDYLIEAEPGMSVLSLLHQVHDEQDGSLAYRYSCRGAICGTCAIRINGTARLACKTQVTDLLKENEELILEPLSHLAVIKDLVVDKRPYWEALAKTMPWLVRAVDLPDEQAAFDRGLDKNQLDQLNRASDCIKCASCYSDCPKIDELPEFIGPAALIQIYKQMFDARDSKTEERKKYSAAAGGAFACDKHAVCVKVCPKDCRPLRAITFIQQKLKDETEWIG